MRSELVSFNMIEEYIGPICALLTACAWAIGVIFFKQATAYWSALGLNYFKNGLALCLFFITFPLVGQSFWIDAPAEHIVYLLLSGAVGIGIADTLFFKCLDLVGAARSAIVECLYSPSIVFFSFLLLGETITALDVVGGILIISSILLSAGKLTSERNEDAELTKGFVLGAISMVLMGISIVAIKPTLEVYPVLWSTTWRLVGGVVVVTLWIPFSQEKFGSILKQCFSVSRWGRALPGAFMGTYVAMIFWIAGFKHGEASITAILNQTATIFTVLLAGLVLKETLTRQHYIGAAAAFCGCILVLV